MKHLIVICICLVFGCNSKENTPVSKLQTNIPQNKTTSAEVKLRNGDLIFHTSRSSQSQAIQLATNSKYSHMGIIYKEEESYFVYEAIQPVKLTKLKNWIDRGENKNYVVKRYKHSEKYLSNKGIQKMKETGQIYIGKDYDLRFEWDDTRIYCSELVWKIYKEAFNIEISSLEKFGNFDLSNKIVQKKLKGYLYQPHSLAKMKFFQNFCKFNL